MKLEGLPEGYEAVRWGFAKTGECFFDEDGAILTATYDRRPTVHAPHLIIRRVKPVATWPRGVFCDGWIAEDADGSQAFYQKERPRVIAVDSEWRGCFIFGLSDVFLPGSVVFRTDLPWADRCIQVGPSVEGADNG
jgi:hypothetical protein